MAAFAHLRTHSHYSLLRGVNAPAQLVARAQADGLSHLALTDHDALIGAVAFAQACHAAALQPITGLTVKLAQPHAQDPAPGEVVLLATGPAGYRSLCRISSHINATLDTALYRRHGLDWSLLREQRAGLICLDGGRRGIVGQAVRQGRPAVALRLASQLAGIFDEAFYLTLDIHSSQDMLVADEVLALANRFGLGAAALRPIYCLDPAERVRLRLLAAIDLNCRLADVPDGWLPDEDDPQVKLAWPDAAEFAARYAAYPEALATTQAIAHMCGNALPDGRPLWPQPILPAQQNADGHLAQLAAEGLAARYAAGAAPAASARLQQELTVIRDHGFAPLFIVVADLVRYARERNIPVSTRGSVANSLVAYCLSITTVDPIEHDLIFERFLNPARTSLPDIDLDFCSRRRDEVLIYVRQKYGEERMALVATISTMRPKSALRETAKAYGIAEATVAALIKRLPSGWHPDPTRRRRLDPRAFIAATEDSTLHPMLNAAFALIGQPHHLSIHPGGVVITPGPLTDYVPLQLAPKGFLTTQFEHGDVEAIGLPKIDLLGIRALTVLAEATELVQQRHDPGFNLSDIPLDDPATGALLAAGETIGVFQCESTGAQRTLRQLQTKSVGDLAIANAFFKPGPATGGMAGPFVRRFRGEEATAYLHEALKPMLANTHGVLIFQEQVLRIAVEVAGLTWAEADHLRRGMSKFQPHEMDEIRARFIAGCMRPAPAGPAFTREQADLLWQQVAAFAGYGFNQGHATAYADVSYRSAYLKAHWPAAFLCARLADWGGFHHQAIYIAEAQRLGIAVYPPHVNRSDRKFTLTWTETGARARAQPQLWMGLEQVRSLRRTTQRAIAVARRQQPFTDLRDLLMRVALQPREVENLIRCGALDGLGGTRSNRAAQLAEAQELRRSGGSQLAFAFHTISAPAETLSERLAWERKILGQPMSASPLAQLTAGERGATLADAQRQPGRQVELCGVRLPGWTGGRGFFLSDGRSFAVAVPREGVEACKPWQLMRIQGCWLSEAWQGGHLQIERIEPLASGVG